MARKVMVEIYKDYDFWEENTEGYVKTFSNFEEAWNFVRGDINEYFAHIDGESLKNTKIVEEREGSTTIVRITNPEKCDPVNYLIFE